MEQIIKTKKKKGFSLVELLVVISIITIMSAVVIASLSSAKLEKQLQTEARKLVAALKEAQNNALTGKSIDGKFPCKYYVQGISTTSFKTFYDSKISINGDCTSSSDYATYVFSYGITANSVFTPISFDVPFGNTSGYTQQIILSKGGQSIPVCVCASGKIFEGSVVSSVQNNFCTSNCS